VGSTKIKVGKSGDMFIGEYQHTVDKKGRMAVPSKFRTQLKKGAIVTRGLDNCLFVYPKEEWQKLADKLVGLPISQAKSRAFSRLMLAGAHEADIDSQGRINIPDHLRSYAKIKQKAVVAGLYNRIEIWDEALWGQYRDKAESESQEIAESLEI